MSRYQQLLARRSVPGRALVANEKYFELLEDDDVKYLLGSMEPLDPAYTKTSLAEAERVYKYLEPFCLIRIQGSITTNTHIRYYSDIDVLTITPEFVIFSGANNGSYGTWTGSPIQVLKVLRAKSKDTIQSNFPAVTIKEKDRALSLSGGSLKRNVDVVACNWFDTESYRVSRNEKDRGVQVLDAAQNITVLNMPFLHQHLLNEKNAATLGGLGRAIRLLKTLKVDADASIEISSYDICSLVWNIPGHLLPGGAENSFVLANNVAQTLLNWLTNEPVLNSLNVPNQTRKIINSEGTTLVAVRGLWHQLYLLLQKISASGKKLDKAATVYGRVLLQL